MSIAGESLVLAVACGVATWAGTGVVLHRARARGLLDIPNERSSHTVPTPRGGGVSVVVTVCAAVAIGWLTARIPTPLAAAMLFGGGAVAAIGWLDDKRSVPARWRALVHALAALLAVVALGGVPSISLGSVADNVVVVHLGPLGWVLGPLFVVWLTNLHNFMDGIDGLAAAHTAVVAILGAALLLAQTPALRWLAVSVAGACVGFLVWNWSPARIFMGDVCSGFLGYTAAVVALAHESHARAEQAPAFVLWVILLAPFVADSTITLVRRVARGDKWYDAHRQHAYQRLVQTGWTHAQVTLAVLGLNVCLATAVAFAQSHPAWTLPAVGFAAIVVLAAYMWAERKKPLS